MVSTLLYLHAGGLIQKGFNPGSRSLENHSREWFSLLWAVGVARELSRDDVLSMELSQDDVVSRELGSQQRGAGFSLPMRASSGQMAQPYLCLNG